MASPMVMPQMLFVATLFATKPVQIIIVGNPLKEDTKELQKILAGFYLPNKVILNKGGTKFPGVSNETLNLLGTLEMIDNKATAYVCKDLACLPPTNDPSTLRALITK